MRTLSNIFKALSDETRLRMLGLLLQKGELCVCDFIDVLDITQSKASRHLRHLVNAGLLDDRRKGTWVYFRIAQKPDAAQAHVLKMLPGVLQHQIPTELLDRLTEWQNFKACADNSCQTLLTQRAAKRRGGNHP